MKALFAYTFLLMPIFAFTYRASAAESVIVLSEDLQLRIADAFMAEEEYYRAITEYKKFLILFPESAESDYVQFRIGIASYRGEEYEASARYMAELREKHPNSGYAAESLYFEGLSYWNLKKYGSASNSFNQVVASFPCSEYAPRSLIADSLVSLDLEDIESSTRLLKKLLFVYPDYAGCERAREALKLLGRYDKLPRKSKALAGALSAVIPGSGYMYAEHYKDGLTAFFINGLGIAGTATGVNQGNYALGALAGTIGLPFYFGNIYGSANAAKKWNSALRRELAAEIYSVLGFQLK